MNDDYNSEDDETYSPSDQNTDEEDTSIIINTESEISNNDDAGDDENLSFIEEDDQLVMHNPEYFDENLSSQILKNMPNIELMMKQSLLEKDRLELFELAEVFFHMEPLTMDWLDVKKLVLTKYESAIKRFKEYESMTTEERDKLESERKVVQDYINLELSLEKKILLLDVPLKYKSFIFERFRLFENMDNSNDEKYKLQEWLNTIVKVPFNRFKSSIEENVIYKLKCDLDTHFFGLDSVKEQILIYVNNRLNGVNNNMTCLALKGPPGIGKTHIALTLSRIFNFPFQQLSGSNMISPSSMCGHSYTYIGSEPGDIVKSLIQMKYNTGILFIDEFDKIPTEKNLNILLQMFDPIQNSFFKDRYLGDIPVDLSKIWFILSMNKLPENKALVDRMVVIDIPKYTFKEKYVILRDFILPSVLKDLKMDIEIDKEAIEYIITYHENVEGVRSIIYTLKDILYKLKFMVQHPSIKTSFTTTMKLGNPLTLNSEIVMRLIRKKQEDFSAGMYG